MKIGIACDHGAFHLKELLKDYLSEKYEVLDFGTDSLESCDYPTFGIACAEATKNALCEFGIVICTSGEGIMISANKVRGIRCGLAYNKEVAALMRQHNNCNMIAIGAKYTSFDDAKDYVDTFLTTDFEGGRHARRVDIINFYEEKKQDLKKL